MTGGADAHRGVDVEADIAGLGQCGTAGVEADPQPNLVARRPAPAERPPLDGKRGLEGRGRLGEDREKLV